MRLAYTALDRDFFRSTVSSMMRLLALAFARVERAAFLRPRSRFQSLGIARDKRGTRLGERASGLIL
jgi:hypothetical protein